MPTHVSSGHLPALDRPRRPSPSTQPNGWTQGQPGPRPARAVSGRAVTEVLPGALPPSRVPHVALSRAVGLVPTLAGT